MRVLAGFAIAALVAAALFIPVHTDVVRAQDGGAVVLDGYACGILLSKPGEDPIKTIFTTKSHTVLTPSGEAILVCHAELTPEYTEGETLVFHDVPCATLGGPTSESHTVITKSGQVLLYCHIHTNGSRA